MNSDHEFRVDFMIVGAQKCGTTTLSQILATHPGIVGCDLKEPHFFSKCLDWRSNLSDYHKLYRRQAGAIYFEASTSYTFYPHRNLEIWTDLHEYNPGLKILYIVRNPVDRLVSAYMHSYERGYTDLPMEAALIAAPLYLNATRYATQIMPFIEMFGRDAVKILFFDDLIRDPVAVARGLAEFLEIDPDEFEDVKEIHTNRTIVGGKRLHRFDEPGPAMRFIRRALPPLWNRLTDNSDRAFHRKPVLSDPYRRIVLHLLRREIEELEALSGRTLDSWRLSPQSKSAT